MHIQLPSIACCIICLPFLIFCLLILHRHPKPSFVFFWVFMSVWVKPFPENWKASFLCCSGYSLFFAPPWCVLFLFLDTPLFWILCMFESITWKLITPGYSYFPLVTSLFQGFFYSSTQLGNKVKNRRSLLSEDICYLLLILQFSPCPLFWTSTNYLG